MRLKKSKGSLDSELDTCAYYGLMRGVGVPEAFAPVLMLRDTLVICPVSHCFMSSDVAIKEVGINHHTIVLYQPFVTAGTLAHESYHYARWLVDWVGALQVMRWLGLRPTDEPPYTEKLYHEEAVAHLMEQTIYTANNMVKSWRGVGFDLEVPPDLEGICDELSVIGRTLPFRI